MMGPKSDIKFGTCVYCGKKRTITDDHIPPRNLFPKPRPSTLITVPSCHPCNNSASKDDEYFRLNLVLREDTPDHPSGKEGCQAVWRSLERPDAKGFRQAFLNRVRSVEGITTSGIYTGQKHVYDVDLTRLDKVVKRITKGLFFHEKGAILPKEYEVDVFSFSGFGQMPKDTQLNVKGIINSLIATKEKTVESSGIFSYWFKFCDGDPYVSSWLFHFYQKTAFFGFILPKNKGYNKIINQKIRG